MARLNLEEDFWIRIMHLVAATGDADKAIGNAIRFMNLAQNRYKQGLIITASEFQQNNFLPSLIGLFAAELDGGGYQYIDAKKEFGWLRSRVLAGQKGGRSKAEKKLKNLKQNDNMRRNEINNLAPKQTEAKRSKPKPLPLSLPLSLATAEAENKTAKKQNKQNLVSAASEQKLFKNRKELHWLAELWNENCGELDRVEELSKKRLDLIHERVAECSNQDIWRSVIKKIAASDFCNARLPGKNFRATFNFLLKPETRINAREGLYDNKKSSHKPNTAAISAAKIDWSVSEEERKRGLAIAAELLGSRKKNFSLPVDKKQKNKTEEREKK